MPDMNQHGKTISFPEIGVELTDLDSILFEARMFHHETKRLKNSLIGEKQTCSGSGNVEMRGDYVKLSRIKCVI